jgi:puromycin-sensitive aminopeptidase
VSHPTSQRNFRLPASVRPVRYDARVSVDLDARTFEGSERIELTLDVSTREIVLHAGAELELERASCAAAGAGGASLTATVTRAKESDTAVLAFDRELAAGPAVLDVTWRGRFCDGLRGLYAAGGMAVTQFEAADARRAFPCFDEPGFKARWKLEVEGPAGYTILSNGAAESEREEGGRKTVSFAETPRLPTYLVALACAKLGATSPIGVRGVPVQTWCAPEKAHLAVFGQEVAVEVLPRLADYFDLPYGFGKLDQLGVPDFEAGAMENAGLVTYREIALLLDPATASLPVKKRVAEVITHELAHQWFGNWVTMQWWDDLWLNEAFATWMAFKIVDAWKPDWRVWLEYDVAKAGALHLDALASTHPVRAEVHNADEATESFDLITYEKGGGVLRMIESWLGEEKFRAGIRLYMRRHAQANAVADDLWGALEESSGQPVTELANAWIRHPGFPLVRCERSGAQLVLSQRRFMSDPAASPGDTLWPVPLVLRWRDGSGVREHRHLLRGPTESLTLPASGDVAWVCANAGATGFYRVAYDGAGLEALAAHLGDLAPPERIALLADGWAQVRAGLQSPAQFMDLVARFGAEQDDAVLDELVGRLAGIEHRLLDAAAREKFQEFVRRLLSPGLAAVGWDPQPGEADGTRLRRAALVRALGLTARDPGVIAEGKARLDRSLAGDASALDANLQEAVVAMVARGGDAARFDAFRARFEQERDPAFKRRYLLAAAHFEAPALAARAQQMVFGDAVPLQDLASFAAALLANRTARDDYWNLLRARWREVEERLGGAPMLLRRIVEAVGQLPERRHVLEAEAHFTQHELPQAKMAIAQTMERMRQDAALWEKAGPAISEWLERRGAL